jgi:predicted O-methyltransferase YrrM
LYSPFSLAKKYLSYLVKANNGKGHGVHSPFVYDFITNVLNDKKQYAAYSLIEKIRTNLLQNNTVIVVEDFGAGSTKIKSNKRKIKAIAASSLKPKKFSQLLFKIINYYKLNTVIELGTSLGITTAYLAAAESKAVTTFEGSKNIAAIARKNLDALNGNEVKIIEGDFNQTLEPFLQTQQQIDLAFIDGNHRKTPTLQYFSQLLPFINESSILVFDDIHWSVEMEEAWAIIKQNNAVTLSIDLFFIGLVFFRKDFKAKQHFTIRF